MHIPPDVQILAAIQTGSVYYFEDSAINSPEPHYYVVLNKSPRTEEFLILLCASSRVEKRQRIANLLGFVPETLVVLQPGEYPLFKKETVIDCNKAFEKSTQTLIDKLQNGQLKICTELMPSAIVERLVSGVLASTQVTVQVQDMLAPVPVEVEVATESIKE